MTEKDLGMDQEGGATPLINDKHQRRAYNPLPDCPMTQRITVTASIQVPRVPHFLRFENGSGTIRVGDVTDASLRGLAAEWTEALLTLAAEQRQETVPSQ